MDRKHLHDQFLTKLTEGDYEACRAIAGDYINHSGSLIALYEELFRRAMYRLGDLWVQGRVSVATEHLASTIVESLMNEFYQQELASESLAKKVIISGVENELHRIGSQMVSDVFEKNGWETIYFGTDTKMEQLLESVGQLKPDIIAMTVSMSSSLPALSRAIERIKASYPSQIILVGGVAFNDPDHHPGKLGLPVMYHTTLQSLDTFLQGLNKTDSISISYS